MTRRHRSLRFAAAIAASTLLCGCFAGRAHRVPGTDMALPATAYGDQILAALVSQCEVSRIPTSTAEEVKRELCTRGDTAAGQVGTVARVPARVP